jgi:hypothetical protein
MATRSSMASRDFAVGGGVSFTRPAPVCFVWRIANEVYSVARENGRATPRLVRLDLCVDLFAQLPARGRPRSHSAPRLAAPPYTSDSPRKRGLEPNGSAAPSRRLPRRVDLPRAPRCRGLSALRAHADAPRSRDLMRRMRRRCERPRAGRGRRSRRGRWRAGSCGSGRSACRGWTSSSPGASAPRSAKGKGVASAPGRTRIGKRVGALRKRQAEGPVAPSPCPRPP